MSECAFVVPRQQHRGDDYSHAARPQYWPYTENVLA